MQRQLAIGCIALACSMLAVLAIATVGAAIAEPAASDPLTENVTERRISFEEYDSGVWPYLSEERGFERKSPVNVVVRGETVDVLRLLTAPDSDWNRPSGNATTNVGAGDGIAIEWDGATGANRYAYVTDGEDGRWIGETAQLQDGTYYGHRYHVRLYESPAENESWVAMQAHEEHFDWFTLRHSVHGTEAAQDRVEASFAGAPPTTELWRKHVGNDEGTSADGWASMVEFALVLSVLTSGTASCWLRSWWTRRQGPGRSPLDRIDVVADAANGGRSGSQSTIGTVLQRHLPPADRRRIGSLWDRLSLRKVLLAGTIAGIVLGVRVAGILLERHAGFLTMHGIAALLYPVLAVGIPLATYVLATGIEHRIDAATTAASGLAAGFQLDYAYLGVETVPIPVLLQRLAVIVALGLLAGGAAQRADRETRLNGLVVFGGVCWSVLLAATLLGKF